jgi:two-component system, OmpR family, phosphate regulon response regulator PhoB
MADKKKTVMIVDDQADARAFVEAVVLNLGDFNIVQANSGDNALELLVQGLPDLMILDVVMPGMNGLSLFYELKKREDTRGIPVIMLTGVAEDIGIRFTSEGMEEYLGAPPAAFLDKPVDPKRLQNVIKEVFGT